MQCLGVNRPYRAATVRERFRDREADLHLPVDVPQLLAGQHTPGVELNGPAQGDQGGAELADVRVADAAEHVLEDAQPIERRGHDRFEVGLIRTWDPGGSMPPFTR